MSNPRKTKTYKAPSYPLNPRLKKDIEIRGEMLGTLKLEFFFKGEESYENKYRLSEICQEFNDIAALFSEKIEALYKLWHIMRHDVSVSRDQIWNYYCYSDEKNMNLGNDLRIRSIQDNLILDFLKKYGPLALSTHIVISKVYEWLHYNQKNMLDKAIQALLEFKHNKPVVSRQPSIVG